MLAAAVAVVASCAVRTAWELAESFCGDSFFWVSAGSVHVVVGGVCVAVVASVVVVMDVAWVWRVRGRGVLCPSSCVGASSAAWIGPLILVLYVLRMRILIPDRFRWVGAAVTICRLGWIV